MAPGVAKPKSVRKVRKVSRTHKVPTLPKESRDFAVLEVGGKSDRQKLEDKATDAAGTYPGTLPERLVYKWCLDNELTFYIQKRVFASFTMFMSAIVDVLILGYIGINKPLVIRIQSQYWHSGSQGRLDDAQAARLRSAGYHVTDVWEADLYRAALGNRLDRFMDSAIRAPV